MDHENRTATRFGREAATDHAAIVQPQRLSGPVEIINESLGGLGWVVTEAEAADFFVGQDLSVVYAGTLASVVVRHVTRREDGRFTIGVQNV